MKPLKILLQMILKGTIQVGRFMISICFWMILFLDLRFKDFKIFKNELVEFSTMKGFEFKYIKSNALRVMSKCFAKNGCN